MWMYMDELYHHGIKGQKWGVRRYQNKDGTLTREGRERYLEEAHEDVEGSIKEAQERVNRYGGKNVAIARVRREAEFQKRLNDDSTLGRQIATGIGGGAVSAYITAVGASACSYGMLAMGGVGLGATAAGIYAINEGRKRVNQLIDAHARDQIAYTLDRTKD